MRQGPGVCKLSGEYQPACSISVTNSHSDVVLSCLMLSDLHGAKSWAHLEGKSDFLLSLNDLIPFISF